MIRGVNLGISCLVSSYRFWFPSLNNYCGLISCVYKFSLCFFSGFRLSPLLVLWLFCLDSHTFVFFLLKPLSKTENRLFKTPCYKDKNCRSKSITSRQVWFKSSSSNKYLHEIYISIELLLDSLLSQSAFRSTFFYIKVFSKSRYIKYRRNFHWHKTSNYIFQISTEQKCIYLKSLQLKSKVN